MPKIKVSF